ncbi:MAG: RdgB/HAM1 family non-canonical purine NTP pyrophosphatase [Chthoniobacterales bacterium]|nr:RdgB/HAM1 family non-canonical purine NTP pyrophosphatase [Chthoniobacterales bacterium]
MTNVSKKRLLLATRNPHKTREVREILGDGWEVNDLTALAGVPEAEESGATFEENARIKALSASPHYDGWALADDSGLEVDALGGAPGVHSARFAGESACMEQNRALLLEKMKGLGGEGRRGRFRCVLALAKSGAVVRTFSGAVEGIIAETERGEGGFGYDPLFVPEGGERTFAEMTAAEKHALSHRGRALALLRDFLRGG